MQISVVREVLDEKGFDFFEILVLSLKDIYIYTLFWHVYED